MNKHIWLLIIVLNLTSCAVGPDYVRPKVLTPNKYKEMTPASRVSSAFNWKKANPQDAIDRGQWWKIYHDKTLNQLENRLVIGNQNIRTAWANYHQARALVDQARANFFPTLIGSLSITRQKRSGTSSFVTTADGNGTDSGTAVSGRSSSGNTISTIQSLLFDASYEPDLWGGVRRNVEASRAFAQASFAQLAAVRLSAQADLAQYYFELRGLDADQKLLNDTVVSYQRSFRLTQNQYRAGIVSRADVLQAQSQLQTAQAAAVQNGVLRAQYEHAIATLIGCPSSIFKILPRYKLINPPMVPVEIPAALLERRPDIASAERLMAEANAQIGVAIAAFFPDIVLSASANNSADSFKRLFSIPNFGWAYGVQLAQTILDGGLRSAAVNAAKAVYAANVSTYRQTVLTAFQEVEDNLVAIRLLSQQAAILKAAAQNAQNALRVINNQYRAGTVVFSNVLLAQANAYAAQKAAQDVNYLHLTATVGLIKSLGGGWHSCCIADFKVAA